MKSPKNDVYAEAARVGATVDWTQAGSVFTITIDAPAGKHWTDGGAHCMRTESRAITARQRDELWSDALERMRAGLADCDPEHNQDCADNAEGA